MLNRREYLLATLLLLLVLPAAGPTGRRKSPAAAPKIHDSETISMRARAEIEVAPVPGVRSGQEAHPIEGGAATQGNEMESQMRRKAAVLSKIRFHWQRLGYEIAFLGPRPGYRAMTMVDRRRIEIYMRSGDSESMQAYDLAHELGHVFDLEYNDSERRRRWLKLRGINPLTPWFGCDRCPDYGTPAGDFAETFALMVLGPGNYHSLMAQTPTPEQIAELAAFCQTKASAKLLLDKGMIGGRMRKAAGGAGKLGSTNKPIRQSARPPAAIG